MQWEAELQVKNYRIKGCQVRLNASMADAYFLFLKEGILNFYTLGFYRRCPCRCGPCKNRMPYTRWLDKHVEWVGAAPPGATNEFQIFHDKLVCTQKLKMMLFKLFFGWVPLLQVIASYYSHKLRLGNLTFGGIQPVFVSRPNPNEVALLKRLLRVHRGRDTRSAECAGALPAFAKAPSPLTPMLAATTSPRSATG